MIGLAIIPTQQFLISIIVITSSKWPCLVTVVTAILDKTQLFLPKLNQTITFTFIQCPTRSLATQLLTTHLCAELLQVDTCHCSLSTQFAITDYSIEDQVQSIRKSISGSERKVNASFVILSFIIIIAQPVWRKGKAFYYGPVKSRIRNSLGSTVFFH